MDDTVAVQKAIDIAKALPGGAAVLLDGFFRVTATLHVDPRVSFVGTAGSGGTTSALVMDHPTADFLKWDVGHGNLCKSRISNVLLYAVQPNSGTVLSSDGTFRLSLLLDNATINADTLGYLQGTMLYMNVTRSRVHARNCAFSIAAATGSACVQYADGDLLLTDCDISTPASYQVPAVYAYSGRASLSGCDFLGGDTPVSGSAINVLVGAGGVVRAVNTNHRRIGTAGRHTAYSWSSGGLLVETNSTFADGVDATLAGNTSILSVGSSMRLRPHAHGITSSTSFTIPDFYESYTIEFQSASQPTFTMPAILFAGQRLRVNVHNRSGTAWIPQSTAVADRPANRSSSIIVTPGSQFSMYEFMVSDVRTAGTLEWIDITPVT